MSAARCDLTWGPLDFHRRSLTNLQAAVQQSRKFCAVMIDTLGRELMIRCAAAGPGGRAAQAAGRRVPGRDAAAAPARGRG
jgi:hypothetical protein